MRILLDTNILTRTARTDDVARETAMRAVASLVSRGHTPCLVSQTLYEFWVVCTRPADKNGLGMTAQQAHSRLRELHGAFEILDDTPAIRPAWEKLVVEFDVRGKPAHDARLAAAMRVHGIAGLLTFNKQDFTRYLGLVVLTPEEALSGWSPIPGETSS
jgi:predicted nucleic acid-binding protein